MFMVVSDQASGSIAMPLVNADEEMAGYLRDAEQYISRKNYDHAIQILQALVRQKDSGFVAAVDGKQYQSLWMAANDMIATMPRKGLERYQALYGPQAKQLYERGISRCDASLLEQVVNHYLNTSFGPKALDAMGAIYFDRGQFYRAIRCWKRAMQVSPNRPENAVLLAKQVVACHLVGDASVADKLLGNLQDKYPSKRANFGGKERDLVQFVKQIRSQVTPIRHQSSGSPQTWSGISGNADGMTTMESSDATLMPSWRQPYGLKSSRGKSSRDLVALRDYLGAASGIRHRFGHNQWVSARLLNGHVQMECQAGRNNRKFICPSMLHPVLVGDKVLCRDLTSLTAYDIYTGKRIWSTSGSFPLCRKISAVPHHRQYVLSLGDNGRYALTVAEGKVFALGNFRKEFDGQSLQRVMRRFRGNNRKSMLAKLVDTSTLAAFSIGKGSSGGTMLWRVGYGKSSGNEILDNCKFLSAPTYHRGRLYVLASYLQNYHLLCLGAESGSLIWNSSVSQLPSVDFGWNRRLLHILSRGSSPAVAGGRVFVTTNAGVIGAFDAETGRAVWAYQYDTSEIAHWKRRGYHSRHAGYYNPVNPLIVTHGKVICLPCGSDSVLALSTENGSLLWETNRFKQMDLSAVDVDRVLLSGPGLVVLSTRDGTLLHSSPSNSGIHGRPAVTAREVIASGQSRIYRLDLKNYRLSRRSLGSTQGILGNLFSGDGKLIAANAMGLCIYFDFAHVNSRLSGLISKADPRRKAFLLFQRGQLAFNAGRFDQACDDLNKCIAQAERIKNDQLPLSAQSWLYRVRVAMGNKASDNATMFEHFVKAHAMARTNQEKAHMLLRLAKCSEKMGNYSRAVEFAQEISDKYPDEELVNAGIGLQANAMVRFDADRLRLVGKLRARNLIRHLIETYPEAKPYAKFEALASKAFAEARGSDDPKVFIAIAEKWLYSSSADKSLILAGEIYYKQALEPYIESRNLKRKAKQSGDEDWKLREQADKLTGKANGIFGQAIERLQEVANRTSSPLRLKAKVAIAIIFSRRDYPTMTKMTCDEIRQLCSRQGSPNSLKSQMTFGEVTGSVEEILKSIKGDKLPSVKAKAFGSKFRLPLKKVFSLADTKVLILRDQAYRPIRLGTNIFLLRDKNVVMFDTSKDSESAATKWSTATEIIHDVSARYLSFPPGYRLVAGLSKDKKVLGVSCSKSIAGLEVATGKILWKQTIDKIGLQTFKCVSVGEGIMVLSDWEGNLTCLDIATGKQRWRAGIRKKERNIRGLTFIRHGVVLIRHIDYRGIACFSADSGKLLGTWTGKYQVQGVLSDKGFLVLLRDGELSVLELSNLAGPAVWKRSYKVTDVPAILDVSDGRIVFSPSQFSEEIEIISVANFGKVISRFSTKPKKYLKSLPMDARLVGNRLFVACSSAATQMRKGRYGQFSFSNGLDIQVFDLSGGKKYPVWSNILEGKKNCMGEIQPMIVTDRYIISMLKHFVMADTISAHIIDIQSGKTLEKVELVKVDANAVGMFVLGAARKYSVAWRQKVIGPPVIIKNRLCAETAEGITVYGKRQ